MGTIAVSGVHGHLGAPVLDALAGAGRRDIVNLDGDVGPHLAACWRPPIAPA